MPGGSLSHDGAVMSAAGIMFTRPNSIPSGHNTPNSQRQSWSSGGRVILWMKKCETGAKAV